MDYNCAYCLEVCFPPQIGLKINVPQFPMWGCHILCFPGAVSKGPCLAVMTFTSRGFRGAKGVAEAACLSVWRQSSSDINSSVQRTLLDASLLVGGLYENRNPWLWNYWHFMMWEKIYKLRAVLCYKTKPSSYAIKPARQAKRREVAAGNKGSHHPTVPGTPWPWPCMHGGLRSRFLQPYPPSGEAHLVVTREQMCK